jgi:hypothetical protein
MPDQPTDFFNIPTPIDKTLAIVEGIASNYVTADQLNAIVTALTSNNAKIDQVQQQYEATNTKIDNLVMLVKAFLNALKGVATIDTQTKMLNQLSQIAISLAELAGTINDPIRIAGNRSSILLRPQRVPAR